uniref:Uncharacterized protein n=1 Tax=Sphaerodactylus townsendi TaxID=933632 RepID=A0ACB8FNH0_9SAUR
MMARQPIRAVICTAFLGDAETRELRSRQKMRDYLAMCECHRATKLHQKDFLKWEDILLAKEANDMINLDTPEK